MNEPTASDVVIVPREFQFGHPVGELPAFVSAWPPVLLTFEVPVDWKPTTIGR